MPRRHQRSLSGTETRIALNSALLGLPAPRGTDQRAERRGGMYAKTKICKFHILGACQKGEGCKFAHHKDELNPLPDLLHTKLCKTLINTGCCEDPSCTFAHNREELRALACSVSFARSGISLGLSPCAAKAEADAERATMTLAPSSPPATRGLTEMALQSEKRAAAGLLGRCGPGLVIGLGGADFGLLGGSWEGRITVKNTFLEVDEDAMDAASMYRGLRPIQTASGRLDTMCC